MKRVSRKPNDNGSPVVSIKRYHGLGDLILLIPVLDKLYETGHTVYVETRPEWAEVFSELRPRIHWEHKDPSVDLDALTELSRPTEHRTYEFGRLLGVQPPFKAPSITIPEAWAARFQDLRGCIAFAPEAEHKARCAPDQWAHAVADHLVGQRLVLVGKNPEPALACSVDLRGRCTVRDLLGVLSIASVVVCMDSGILHVAASIGTPTVAVFGGVNPEYRIMRTQRVIALQADMPCCPCDKNESCGEQYPCLSVSEPGDIADALEKAAAVRTRRIVRLNRGNSKL
jgi:hypothetical protein